MKHYSLKARESQKNAHQILGNGFYILGRIEATCIPLDSRHRFNPSFEQNQGIFKDISGLFQSVLKTIAFTKKILKARREQTMSSPMFGKMPTPLNPTLPLGEASPLGKLSPSAGLNARMAPLPDTFVKRNPPTVSSSPSDQKVEEGGSDTSTESQNSNSETGTPEGLPQGLEATSSFVKEKNWQTVTPAKRTNRFALKASRTPVSFTPNNASSTGDYRLSLKDRTGMFFVDPTGSSGEAEEED
ncbi:MAG: hypothetical protein K2X66_02290 [Cyanobacteria bacterium]|nr:hypothetical protein [Cyanobacteriota bacterium]